MHWWEVHNLPAYALGGCPDDAWQWPWYIDTVAHPELLQPDANGDGRVSVEESFAWAVVAQQAALPQVKAWGGGPLCGVRVRRDRGTDAAVVPMTRVGATVHRRRRG